MNNGSNRVPNGCRELMQRDECNRRAANRINTSNDVPLATVSGSHSPRTIRARFLGFAPNARPRLVCGVFKSTTCGGIALGFTRYYFPFARREGLTNSHGRGKTCLLRGVGLRGLRGLAALDAGCRRSQTRPAAGGLADVARIAALAWTATAGTASPAPTPRPAADVAAAADCTHGAARVIAADGLGDLDGRLSPLTEFHNQCPQHVGAFQIKGARYDRSQ